MFLRGQAHPDPARKSAFSCYFFAAHVLPHLGALRAVHWKTIEAWFIHPDPDWKAFGHVVFEFWRGEIGDLLLSDGEWKFESEVSQHVVGPWAAGDNTVCGTRMCGPR